jgi:AmmeMemoRadiSam system protein A
VKEVYFEIAKTSVLYYRKYKSYAYRKLGRNGASFVTFLINNELRGCIGSILPIRDLGKDIAVNAVNAAFFDPRFYPMTLEELRQSTMEISILSPLKPFKGTPSEFLEYIGKEKPGVYIFSEEGQATFLPDVWDEIPEPLAFMRELSKKAGLDSEAWRNMQLFTYTTESEKRKWTEIGILEEYKEELREFAR